MFSYRPNFIPNKVLIIGCGGTGSRLVPLLAQFIKTCAWVPDPEITLIDDDIVEEKNLFRQNFISPDVGKPKAEVLANRYSRAFNIPINALQVRVPTYKKLSAAILGSKEADCFNVLKTYAKNSIVVLCVDSPQARRDILNSLISTGVGSANNVLLLDSGNENDFGQVSVSTMIKPDINEYLDKLPNSIPGDIEMPGLPIDLSYFRDMQATSTPSCADLDQTMAINTMMAVTMFGIIQNFYYAKPFLYHRINISLSHGATPQYMNTDFIKHCCKRDNATFENLYIQSASFQNPVSKFYREVFEPFQQAVKAAEKAAELAKKLKEETNSMKKERVAKEGSLAINTGPADGVEGLAVATAYTVDEAKALLEEMTISQEDPFADEDWQEVTEQDEVIPF